MEINDLIQDELINIAKEDLDYKEVIKYLGKTFLNKEYIKEEYINDVLTREESFPTGIKLENMGIAIPHANADNVLKNGISILKLKAPVKFSNMETGEDVYVSMAFMLALKDPTDHLKMLQSLFIMFQQDDVMDELINASTTDKMKSIVTNNLKWN